MEGKVTTMTTEWLRGRWGWKQRRGRVSRTGQTFLLVWVWVGVSQSLPDAHDFFFVFLDINAVCIV